MAVRNDKIDFKLMSDGDIERIVDKGLRHRSGVKPFDYLEHWLWIGRHFGFATHDESWGEFEKEFAIIIRRMVSAERERDALKATFAPPNGIARDGIEAQHGLNDTFPGDPYP